MAGLCLRGLTPLTPRGIDASRIAATSCRRVRALPSPVMPVSISRRFRRTVETLLIAAVGGFLFNLAKFPAGWLAGAMVFCAAASLAGRPLGIPHNLARAFFIVLGMSIGGVATPATVAGMAAWPASILAVTLAMGAVTLGTVFYLKRVHGWETLPAVFGGLPGGLSQVMALAAEQGLDLRAIAIVQTMRVVILAVGVPAGLALFGLAGPARLPSGAVAVTDAPGELLLMVVPSIAVALILLRSGFPGGLIFGPMVVSAVLHGGDFVHITFPTWFANIAMVGLGAVSGSRFSGTPVRLVLSYLGAALGSFAVSIVIAAGFGLAVTQLLSLRISDVVVAYAPGSIDAMMILALALHLDPVFVGAHHLARVFTVTLALPLIVRWTVPRTARKSASGRAMRPSGESFGE
jgi:membrane AbrB-like protein